MDGDNILKVRIYPSEMGLSYKIWIYYETEGVETNKYKVLYSKDENWEFKEIDQGNEIKPTLEFSEGIMRKLFEAVHKLDFKVPEQSKIEGLYEASQKHLEDMRKLVFKIK